MKDYPRSFLLENCEGREELAELVKTYTLPSKNREKIIETD